MILSISLGDSVIEFSSSANQYARDVERIDADNSVDSTDTSGLTRKERKDRKKTRLDNIHQIKGDDDCSSFPSFEAALFVPRDDLSFLKCEDKTKSLTTASALPSLISSINDRDSIKDKRIGCFYSRGKSRI
jgi:hypothetical protein